MEAMTTPLKRLADLVRQRRHELKLGRLVAARSVEMSKDTWAKVERGEPVRGLSYARIEQAVSWAPGSCQAVLDGGDPVPIEAGREGGVFADVPQGMLEETVRQAVTTATVESTTTLTSNQIKAINDRVVRELQRHGVLPGSSAGAAPGDEAAHSR